MDTRAWDQLRQLDLARKADVQSTDRAGKNEQFVFLEDELKMNRRSPFRMFRLKLQKPTEHIRGKNDRLVPAPEFP